MLSFFLCSTGMMWPISSGLELREDIRVLIKFWQAIISDKKYMKNIMIALDLGSSTTSGSTVAVTPAVLGPAYGQVKNLGIILMLCMVTVAHRVPRFSKNYPRKLF